MSWTDFVVPLLAVLSSLPPLTMAWLAGHKTRDPARQLFAGGLALASAIIFLVTAGVFVDLTLLAPGSGLKFLFWNLTFLLAFGSLLVLRRFARRLLPVYPRRDLVFWVASGLFYAVTLVLAFALTPPLIDFRSSTASFLGSVYYLAGIAYPVARLWAGRGGLPKWLAPLAGQMGRYLVPLGVVVALWEGVRALGWVPGAVSGIAVVFLAFFALVSRELVRRFPAGPEGLSFAAKARRVVERFPAQKVTPREEEVLALLLEGRKNAEIAAALGLSTHTVKNHIYNLYQKLGTDTRVELLQLAEG